MRFDFSDNLLLVATCIGLYWSYYTIKNTLQEVKEATCIPDPVPVQPKPRQLDPNAEDQIDAKTLRTLSKSHNYEVRNAAIKILITRACKPETKKQLLRDLRSINYARRDHAINGLWLLLYGVDMNDVEGNAKRQKEFQNQETYESIVRALVNVLPEHDRVIKGKATGRWALEMPPSPIRPKRRPPHELSLMIMLTFLMGSAQKIYNDNGDRLDAVEVALEAGLVTKWLTRYPFPCAMLEYGKGNFKKSDVVSLFESNAYSTDDNLMSGVTGLLTRSPKGMKELRKAGLTTSTFKEDVKPVRRRRSWERLDDEIDTLMVGGEDTAGLPRWTSIEGVDDGPRQRSSDRSQEEDRLRRRHREAIVVADHGEPLSHEHILQRQDSGAGITPVVFLDEDDAEEQESNAAFPDEDSIPSLEEVQAEPIDRSLNESPQSFRRRVSERMRQGFGSFPIMQRDQSVHEDRPPSHPENLDAPRGTANGVFREEFEAGWGDPLPPGSYPPNGRRSAYDVLD